jgi:hypothetical protein
MSINDEHNIIDAYRKVAIDRAELILKVHKLRELEDQLINGEVNFTWNNIDFMMRLNFIRWYVQKLTEDIRLGLIYADQLAQNSGFNEEELRRVHAVPTDFDFELFRQDLTPISPGEPEPLYFDFSEIPRVEINVDLTGKWDILTRDIFVPGTDYYCITIDLPPEIARGRPLHSVEYYSIDALEHHLFYSRTFSFRYGRINMPHYIKDPYYDFQISLENITRFTYRGPNQGPDQGGKPMHKRSYINKNKTKKSLKKRLYR